MHIHVAPLVVSADVDGALVVMDEHMQFFELDQTGRIIWELISSGSEVDTLITSFAAAMNIDLSIARHDFLQFIQQLADENLVVINQ